MSLEGTHARGRRLGPACVVLLAGLALLAALGGCTESSAPDEPVTDTVRTGSGRVGGTDIGEVEVFLGVPYAKAPTGELRWRPPEPPEPWEGVRPATQYGPMCPQQEATGLVADLTGEAGAPMDEDCLHLNLWTPAERTSDALPVMVWLHGGSLTSGSNRNLLYDGAALAERGAVVVVPNYRLGPLGFLVEEGMLAEEPAGAAGNWGLHDQVAVLEWVQANVAAFGGDPDNVTVFGESAGGLSIAALMTSGRAAGLFDRAIIQSGAAPDVLRGLEEAPTGMRSAVELGAEFADRLGLGVGAPETTLARLRNEPVDALLAAAEAAGGSGPAEALPTGPVGRYLVLDGALLEEAPGVVFERGEQAPVPLIVGTVRDEGTLFTAGMGVDTVAEYEDFVRSAVPDAAEEVLAAYPAATDAEVRAALARFVGDAIFQTEARKMARLQTQIGQPVYRYVFSRAAPAAELFGLGAFHGSELPYVFGTTERAGSLLGGEAGSGVEAADERLSSWMMDYWVAFARSGDPNGGDTASNSADTEAGRPEWPAYEPERDNVLVLDADPSVVEGFRTEELDLLDRVFDESGLVAD